MFRTGCLLCAALFCAWLAAPSAAAPAAKNPLAAETAAWTKAKPVLTKYCAKCHTPGGASITKKRLGRFDFSSYPVTGTYATTIGVTMRQVLGMTGGRAIMPADQPGAVTGAELAAVKAWSDAWVAAEQAGAHQPRTASGSGSAAPGPVRAKPDENPKAPGSGSGSAGQGTSGK